MGPGRAAGGHVGRCRQRRLGRWLPLSAACSCARRGSLSLVDGRASRHEYDRPCVVKSAAPTLLTAKCSLCMHSIANRPGFLSSSLPHLTCMPTMRSSGGSCVITRPQGTHAWCMGCRWFRCDNACGMILLRCVSKDCLLV